LHGTGLTAGWPLIQEAYRFGFAFVSLDCFAGTFTVGVYFAPQFALNVFIAHGFPFRAHVRTNDANVMQRFQLSGFASILRDGCVGSATGSHAASGHFRVPVKE
jgi:hypothetical protein